MIERDKHLMVGVVLASVALLVVVLGRGIVSAFQHECRAVASSSACVVCGAALER
jgi:hypothetical protein